jgi:Zn-dependent protease
MGKMPQFSASIELGISAARTALRAAMDDAAREHDIRFANITGPLLFAGGFAASAPSAPSALGALVAAPALLSGSNAVEIALTIVLIVLCLGFHEAAHAWVAWKCGDSTGKDLGRITLNPIPHIDLFMTIILPGIMLATSGFAFGGAKPVPVNFYRLRHPWRDMSLVALAGPLSNLFLALLFLAAWKFFVTTGFYNDASLTTTMRQEDLLPQVLSNVVMFNLLLTVFNLVPIPPLDGSRVMAWLLPPSLREPYSSMERWGLIIVAALVFLSPGFNNFIFTAMITLRHGLERIVSLGGLW